MYSLFAGVPILMIAWVGCAVQKRIPKVVSLTDYALRVSLLLADGLSMKSASALAEPDTVAV